MLYSRWRQRYGRGWGLAWFLAAEILRRHAHQSGLVGAPQVREGLGWYGILLQVPDPDGRPAVVGRVTASGDVEDWGAGEHDRLALADLAADGATPTMLVQRALRHLPLHRLDGRPSLGAQDRAVEVQVLARLALQCQPDAFDLQVERDVSQACVAPPIILRGPGGSVRLVQGQEHGAGGTVNAGGRYLAGESAEGLAGELGRRIGLFPRVRESTSPGDGYSLSAHRHRYAAWCAARAASRGLAGATNEVMRRSLEHSGLPGLLAGCPSAWPASSEVFDRLHRGWCGQVVSSLHADGVDAATFGRAAKLVAVYIKTMVICGGHDHTPLAAVAHPPVDRLLLQALAAEKHLPVTMRAMWRETSWTKLGVDAYDEVIASFREVGFDQVAFWQIERLWMGD